MSLLKISFFRAPKMRVFDYKPRFWNPEIEHLEERRRKTEKEMGIVRGQEAVNADDPYRPKIKGEMVRRLKFGKRKSMTTGNARLLTLIILLLLLVGAFFASDFVSLLFTDSGKSDVKTEQPAEPEKRNEDTHFIIPLD